MGGKVVGVGACDLRIGLLTVAIQCLALLVAELDRLGHYEPASTISGFADTQFTRISFPEINAAITQLCEVLGDQKYRALAEGGKT
jgi:hypothetical protein